MQNSVNGPQRHCNLLDEWRIIIKWLRLGCFNPLSGNAEISNRHGLVTDQEHRQQIAKIMGKKTNTTCMVTTMVRCLYPSLSGNN